MCSWIMNYQWIRRVAARALQRCADGNRLELCRSACLHSACVLSIDRYATHLHVGALYRTLHVSRKERKVQSRERADESVCCATQTFHFVPVAFTRIDLVVASTRSVG